MHQYGEIKASQASHQKTCVMQKQRAKKRAAEEAVVAAAGAQVGLRAATADDMPV
jgi:hypothetical protein